MQKIPKKGFIAFFTGLSGSGKTTVADKLFKLLQNEGYKMIQRLDGDLVRMRLTKDLGFSEEDRRTNIDRVSFVSELLSSHGVGVLSTFIAPTEEIRKIIKDNHEDVVEIFVNTPIDECKKRDTKGLYIKAQNGEIQNFTGITGIWEEPTNPDIILNTHIESEEESVIRVYDYLKGNGFI